jgi:hypothetical protein
MVRLPVKMLPKHVQDVIELREATDMTFSRLVDEDYNDIFYDIIQQRRRDKEHHLMLSIHGPTGQGKSMSALTIAALLDPEFSVDRVFFSYQELVYARASLPDNCCVIVDEQAAMYGVDSHRIMVILGTLKEQLRKRGVSFIFCSPVLYSESESSHYIIETVYIDEEEQEVVAALKSPEKLVYGHINIPHPLKPIDERGSLLTKEFLDAYQAKKDAHLEEVLGRKSMDPTEEHAAQVVKNPIFKKAEKIYIARYKYIPQGSLQQLIGKIFPEFAGNVMAGEVAGRVRLNKETSGEWSLPGGIGRK